MQYYCVHNETPFAVVPVVTCAKPTVKKSHGYLCIVHHRHQQNNIPPAPRKVQPKWIGFTMFNASDEAIVRDIIATDAAKIAAGTIEVVRFGSVDPSYVRYVS